MDDTQLETCQAVVDSKKPLGAWDEAPAVPATTVPVINTSGFPMWVEVNGGTVTAVTIDGVKIGSTARVAGYFRVRSGSTIAMTYSAAPTWQWFYE